MTSKEIALAAKIERRDVHDIEFFVKWVADYDRGLNPREPTETAKRVAGFVEFIKESLA